MSHPTRRALIVLFIIQMENCSVFFAKQLKLSSKFNSYIPGYALQQMCDDNYRANYMRSFVPHKSPRGKRSIKSKVPSYLEDSVEDNAIDESKNRAIEKSCDYSNNGLVCGVGRKISRRVTFSCDINTEMTGKRSIYRDLGRIIAINGLSYRDLEAKITGSEPFFHDRRAKMPEGKTHETYLGDLETKIVGSGTSLRKLQTKIFNAGPFFHDLERNLTGGVALFPDLEGVTAGETLPRDLEKIIAKKWIRSRDAIVENSTRAMGGRIKEPLKKYDGKAMRRFYSTFDIFRIPSNGHPSLKDAAERHDANSLFGWADHACSSVRRIVNGWITQSPEQLPYMVFVDSGCGGAIIGDRWVLTAGHCVADDVPTYVYAGSIDLFGGCQYNVVQVYVHPNYPPRNLPYDLGLIKINPTFVYSPTIKPIMLSKVSARYKMCGTVAGWGAKYFGGPIRCKLMMTRIPVTGRKNCQKFGIRKGQFCAGYKDGNSDACVGDSGGPFVVGDYVVGIVSFGHECGRPKVPGVYVDVSYHRQWIYDISRIS